MQEDKNTLAVIGANGYIGSFFIKYFTVQKYNVIGVTRHGDEINISFDEFLKGKQKPRVVIHAHAYIPWAGDTDYQKLYETNISSISKVTQAYSAAYHVYLSSVSVYGDEGREEVEENSTLKPNNSYSISKYSGECLIKECDKFAILRLSSPWSLERLNEHTFLYKVLKSVKDTNTLRVIGNPSRRQDYIAIEDISEMIKILIDQETNGIYNSCRGLSISNQEIFDHIKFLNSSIKEEIVQPDLVCSSHSYSIHKAIEELGWSPSLNIINHLKEIYEKI